MSDTVESYIKAIRLYNLPDGSCTFETGKIHNKVTIDTKGFFAQTHIDPYQKVAHPAPQRQFVATLQGRLEFKVTNGDTFIIEPGILLLAEDTEGEGHTWTIIEGDIWQRIYIPLVDGAYTHFIAN